MQWGGDFAPQNAVVGAVKALEEKQNIELFLVGKKQEIQSVLTSNNLSFKEENIINADEVIGMDEQPTAALKSKKNSSIVVGTSYVRDNKADAFVSAGRVAL